ncbi:hypothetical protein BVX98_06715, partial [bacterium F11]
MTLGLVLFQIHGVLVWGQDGRRLSSLAPGINPLHRQPFQNSVGDYRPLSFFHHSQLRLDFGTARLPSFDVWDLENRLWQYQNLGMKLDGESRVKDFS